MVQKKLLFQTSRTSPALDRDVLYIRTQPHALIIAVDRLTGEPIADIVSTLETWSVNLVNCAVGFIDL